MDGKKYLSFTYYDEFTVVQFDEDETGKMVLFVERSDSKLAASIKATLMKQLNKEAEEAKKANCKD